MVRIASYTASEYVDTAGVRVKCPEGLVFKVRATLIVSAEARYEMRRKGDPEAFAEREDIVVMLVSKHKNVLLNLLLSYTLGKKIVTPRLGCVSEDIESAKRRLIEEYNESKALSEEIRNISK